LLWIDNVSVVGDVVAPQCSVAATSTPAGCDGNDGTATAVASNTTGVVNYAWSNGGSGSTISGLAPGSYTVTITDDNCTATATFNVGLSCIPPGNACDTIGNFDLLNDNLALYSDGSGGYVSGTNSYGDISKADYYDYNGTNTHLKGVYMLFGPVVASNTTNTFNVRVWNGTGETVGTLLSSFPLKYSEVTANALSYIEFDEPILLPASKEVFVGISFAGTGLDTVSLYTNTDGDMTAGTGTAWEQFSDNNCYNYNSINLV